MDSMQLVTPAIGLMFWTVVIFMLLLILLKKFAWKPILKAVDDRNSSINEALASAEKAKSEMEQLSADNDKILNEAHNQRDSIIKEAMDIKIKTIADAKNKASIEAEKIIFSAKEQIKNHKSILEKELNLVGIRLNQKPPKITYTKKKTGGVKITFTCDQTKLGDNPTKTVKGILQEYKIHNAEIIIRQEIIGDQLIDVIEGNRKYVRCLYLYNKIAELLAI